MSGCRRVANLPRRFGASHHCPWTNGKVERLNRTLAIEWAYSRVWTSNTDRTDALPAWLKYHNPERPHLGIGGSRPINRVDNGPGQYS